MYLDTRNSEFVFVLIRGFKIGFQTCHGVAPDYYSHNLIRKRRLKTSALGLYGFIQQMRSRKWSEERIVDELFAIQIETWQDWLESDGANDGL